MHTSIHSGGTGNIRHSPRNGFNGFLRALPGDDFLFATVTSRIAWRPRPVGPISPPQGLASATDARTTRLRRTHQCRSSRTPRSLTNLFALRYGLACTTSSRPPHPTPTFVTIASRPSSQGGMAAVVNLIWVFRKAIYFRVRTGHEFANPARRANQSANKKRRVAAAQRFLVPPPASEASGGEGGSSRE
jgi:hypothetical protein